MTIFDGKRNRTVIVKECEQWSHHVKRHMIRGNGQPLDTWQRYVASELEEDDLAQWLDELRNQNEAAWQELQAREHAQRKLQEETDNR